MQWYADRGIVEYWLAEPAEGDRWGAIVSRYALARTAAGDAAYIRTDVTTLAILERASHGLSSSDEAAYVKSAVTTLDVVEQG